MRLTLSQLDVEASDVEPFEFDPEDGGDVIVFAPASQIPSGTFLSDDIETIDGIRRALRQMIGSDGLQRVLDAVPLRGLYDLMNSYIDHYGISDMGEGDASPNSSNRAARRSKRTSGSQRTGKAS